MSLDKSLIRLFTSFAEAKQSTDPVIVSVNYHGFVQLSPSEEYCQVTKLNSDATVSGAITAYLIDCNGAVLKDVSANFGLITYTDDNGILQFVWELAYINQDFYSKQVFLRIDSDSTPVYYSNGFCVSAQRIEETSRFDYKSVGYNDELNIDFSLLPLANNGDPITLSTRTNGFWNDIEDEQTSKEYQQMKQAGQDNGITISVDAHIYEKDLYRIEYFNIDTYRKINKVLCQDIIHLNGSRVTNKPFMKKGERKGQANIFTADFSGSINHLDTYEGGLQIIESLQLLVKSPEGIMTLAFFNANFGGWLGIFNKTVTKNIGSITLYKDGVMRRTWTQDEIDVSDTLISASFEVPVDVDGNGEYYFNVSPNLFYSGIETFPGISNTTDWAFTVAEGEYDGSEYDNNEYFTT